MFKLIDNYTKNSKNHGSLFSRYEYTNGQEKYMNHKRKINFQQGSDNIYHTHSYLVYEICS